MYNISSTIYLYCRGTCGYSSVGEIICQCSPACKNLVQQLNHEMNDEMQKKKKKKKNNLQLLPNQEKMPQRPLGSFLEDPGGLLIKPHRGYFVIFVDLD